MTYKIIIQQISENSARSYTTILFRKTFIVEEPRFTEKAFQYVTLRIKNKLKELFKIVETGERFQD